MTQDSFSFDGCPLPFRAGQSLAAALLEAEIRSWRSTRFAGRPRGVFCGIGICFDCLLVVDDEPNVRACVTPARAGLVVRTQEGDGHEDLVR